MWQVDLGDVNVQWSEQGDEWSHHLSAALMRRFSGLSRRESPGGGVEITVRCDALRSALEVLPSPQGMKCLVAGEDQEQPDDSQVEPWRVAVREAEAAVGTSNSDFSWYAVLGPHPFLMNTQPDTRTLGEEIALGPVTLTPAGSHMCEWLPSSDLRMGWTRRATTWPVVARGSEPSYDALLAMQRARVPLRRACALLSLALNDCWDVRYGPHPLPSGEPVPPVPHYAHVMSMPDGSPAPLEEDDGGGPPVTVPLPEPIAGAWSLLEENAVLASALDAFYEGIKLRATHPSIAFMMFVVAIEAVGNTLEERATCSCCEECQAEVGAQRRFRLALAKAVPKKQVHSLSAAAYRYRSLTAHQGRLHGPEVSLGMPSYSMFQPEPTRQFRDEDVAQMRAASRGVLLWALEQASQPG